MKIHFIGIGGIGLSALARILKHDGHSVSGSDIKETPLTQELKKRELLLQYLIMKVRLPIKTWLFTQLLLNNAMSKSLKQPNTILKRFQEKKLYA